MALSRILVVDDDKDILRMLEFNLQRLGSDYEIITTSDISSALRYVEQYWIDLILTDYMMPGMTGVDLARAVHRISPDTQIVLMTAYSSTKLRDTTNYMGIDGYLNKPFDMDELKALIQQCAHRSKSEQAARLHTDKAKQSPAADATQTIDHHLQELKTNAGVRAVLLINNQGKLIQTAGQIDNTKIANIAKLVATNFMNSQELSGLLDNKKMFKSGSYEGDTSNIYICSVHAQALLAVVFDVTLRPGVVWFYSKQTAVALAPLID